MIQHIMMRRKLAVYLPVSAVLSVIAGAMLYGRGVGMGMTFGAAAAITAVILGMGISAPATKKLSAVSPSGSIPLRDEERHH